MRWILSKPFAGSLVVCAALTLTSSNSFAEEVVVQNDRVVNGSSAFIQAGFVAGESGAAWLTAPCDGDIVAVQIFWRSLFGDTGQILHDSITIYAGGVFPTPGVDLLTLEGPVMTDNFLNEFRYLDEQQTVPFAVPVSQGETFVVSFKFLESPNPLFGPSLVTDSNGCQFGRNAVQLTNGTWINPCALGMSGDFFIRAVIDCPGTGACCHGVGLCDEDVSEDDCENVIGGVYLGDNTNCLGCPQSGACCFLDGTCADLLQQQCLNNGGTFQGPQSSCAAENCPQPLGACCFLPSGCLTLTEADCAQISDSEWGGPGTDCGGFDCFPMGACCLPDGSCSEGSPEDCTAAGGTYQGNFTFCIDTECPMPMGACCLSNGNCLALTEADCGQIPNSSWAGAQTTCADDNMNGDPDACEPPGGCQGDLVTSRTFQPPPDGKVDGADLAFLLGEWGPNPGSPADMVTSATFEPPPDGIVDGADLAVLLGAWGRCP